jgi:hypothetical protein
MQSFFRCWMQKGVLSPMVAAALTGEEIVEIMWRVLGAAYPCECSRLHCDL